MWGSGWGLGVAAPPLSAALAPRTPGCWWVVCVNLPRLWSPVAELNTAQVSSELAVGREGSLGRWGQRPTWAVQRS